MAFRTASAPATLPLIQTGRSKNIIIQGGWGKPPHEPALGCSLFDHCLKDFLFKQNPWENVTSISRNSIIVCKPSIRFAIVKVTNHSIAFFWQYTIVKIIPNFRPLVLLISVYFCLGWNWFDNYVLFVIPMHSPFFLTLYAVLMFTAEKINHSMFYTLCYIFCSNMIFSYIN